MSIRTNGSTGEAGTPLPDYQTVNKAWLSKMGIKIDWIIEERNKQWHDAYFTTKAVHDHQAKGNCRLCWMVIEEMEERNWIEPKKTVILDPMCGIGSFLIVAALKGYNGVGIELEDTFYKDMVGEECFVDREKDDLFAGSFMGTTPGTIERFHRLTSNVRAAGRIQIIKGNARFTHDIMARTWEDVIGWWTRSGALGVICSPPYGNRLWDDGQKFGSKDNMTLNELSAMENETSRRQYSNASDNIGTCKVAVVNSPPYSRSTEHSDGQMDSFQDKPVTGHRGWSYSDRQNIAVLKDSEYTREMQKVYNSLYKTLPIGSPVALITRNFIQKGRVVLLDELTMKLMRRAGFAYQFTRRGELPDISFFKIMNWNKVHRHKGLPLITWEEVTFYRKEK